jgi:multiple sugar transport system ATP-binding protein
LLRSLNGHANSAGLALGIRPEGVMVRRESVEGFIPMEAQIIEPLGSFDIVDLKIGDQVLRARTTAGYVKQPGDKVFVRIDPEQAHFFDAGSGKSIDVDL